MVNLNSEKNIAFDLHTHHERCGHAVGNIREYIDAAIDRDLNVIGISDHSPFFYSAEDQLHPKIAMGIKEFDDYVQEVLNLKKEYQGKIEILLGVESDFFPNHVDIYKKYYSKYPFDYIIGSVHFVNDISIFKRDRWEGLKKEQKVRAKESYYNLIQQSAKSGMFQIIGHIDAMKGYYPEFSFI